jgi:predicted AAA+ superfamily ATPase
MLCNFAMQRQNYITEASVYLPRALEPTVANYLASFPVVGIAGPRQSGKSTMVLHALGGKYEYITFDDFNHLQAFQDDPERFMRLHAGPVIFDEVHRVPELFIRIKRLVDRERRLKGRFVLTGSSQFAVMKHVSESLAGRIGLLTLLPFQRSETPASCWHDAIWRGTYPELIVERYAHREEWYSSYLETYLTRDVRDLGGVGDLRDFRRCLVVLAGRAGQLLNISEIARDLGVAVNTVKRWISVMESSFIVYLLKPWYKNMDKRLVKSPKVYFVDPGLAAFLTGIQTETLFERGPLAGPLFENYVISEVLKRELHSGRRPELSFIRTSNGVEVDLVIDRGMSHEFIEIKNSATFRPDLLKGLHSLKGKADKGILVYRGEGLQYDEDLAVVNFSEYLVGPDQK